MDVGRHTWGVGLGGIAIVLLGVLTQRPVLLVGGVVIGGWLIGRQIQAVQTVRTVDDTLDLTVETARPLAAVDQEVRVIATARLDQPAPAQLEVVISCPVGADAPTQSARTIELAAGEQRGDISFGCTFPTAGSFTFPQQSVTVTPSDGLFTETLSRDVGPTVRVEARTPADLHVGQGGDTLALSYGEHPGGRGEGGLSPEELRQYQPGDAADRIDWKATARHRELYIREYETQSDRRTVVILDHRQQTGTGPEGATLFAYLREVAFGFIDGAAELSDPVGLWTVGDQGVTGRFSVATGGLHYTRLRTHLRELSPTEQVTRDSGTADSGSESTGSVGDSPFPHTAETVAQPLLRPTAVAARQSTLADAETPFATTLSQYFANRRSYVERLQGDPLFGTVKRVRARTQGTTLSVIITDDSRREQLLETLRLATRNGDYAFVFLAPQLLFTQRGATEVETDYNQYVEFEEFRRTLDNLPRVTAFEVGPGDRLDRLLASRRRQTSAASE